MNIVVGIAGVFFIFAAVVYLLKPNVIKQMMEFFKQGKRLYLAGVIRLILAIVFLLGARECKYMWVITGFGILLLVSGMLIFVIRLEKLKALIGWWQKRSVVVLRILALITLVIGAIIVYSA